MLNVKGQQQDDISSKWHSEKHGSSGTNIRQNYFKIEKVKKDTDRHFRMIKGILHQEHITFISIYDPN